MSNTTKPIDKIVDKLVDKICWGSDGHTYYEHPDISEAKDTVKKALTEHENLVREDERERILELIKIVEKKLEPVNKFGYYKNILKDLQELINPPTPEHICCDGECNHDDCCGKVEANCPNYKPMNIHSCSKYCKCARNRKLVDKIVESKFHQALLLELPEQVFNYYTKYLRQAITEHENSIRQAEKECGNGNPNGNIKLTSKGGCRKSVLLTEAYRCTGCGVWFHKKCVFEHFKMEVEHDWGRQDERERIEKKQQKQFNKAVYLLREAADYKKSDEIIYKVIGQMLSIPTPEQGEE